LASRGMKEGTEGFVGEGGASAVDMLLAVEDEKGCWRLFESREERKRELLGEAERGNCRGIDVMLWYDCCLFGVMGIAGSQKLGKGDKQTDP